MNNDRLELKLGMFMVVCLGLAVALATNFGNTIWWKPGRTVKIKANSAGNLVRQAEVKMAGFTIGYVKEIKLNDDGNGTQIYLFIYDKYKVHENDRFSVESRGLMGDQYVSVEKAQKPGAELNKDSAPVIAKAPINLEKIGEQVDKLVSRIEQDMLSAGTIYNLTNSIGNLDKVLSGVNDSIGNGTFDQLRASIANVHQSSIELKKIFKEQNITDVNKAIANIGATSKALKEFSEDLSKDVGKIVTAGNKAAENVEDTAGKIKEITETINETVNKMEKMLADTQPKLAIVMANAAKISAGIEETVATNKVIVGHTLENVQKLTGRLDKTAAQIEKTVSSNRGDISEIVANVKVVSENLKKTTEDISKVVAQFEQGKGLAGGLFKNDQMQEDFSKMVKSFSSAAGKLSTLTSNLNENGILWSGERTDQNSSRIFIPPQPKTDK
jgi:ABC-type transporter Mla subunit MlaD